MSLTRAIENRLCDGYVDYQKWVLPENQQQLDHVPAERTPYTPKPYPFEEKNRHSTEDVFEFDEVLWTLCPFEHSLSDATRIVPRKTMQLKIIKMSLWTEISIG